MDNEKAQAAVARFKDMEYTRSTSGWAILQDLRKKAEEQEFSTSISSGFAEKVLANPSVYFEHRGFVNGLRFFEEAFREAERTAIAAIKDLDKAEKELKRKQEREYHER